MVLRFVGCLVAIYEENMVFFGSVLVVTVYVFSENLQKFLQMSLAIANRATTRELADLWMHPLLFKVERDDRPSEDPVERVRREVEELELG